MQADPLDKYRTAGSAANDPLAKYRGGGGPSRVPVQPPAPSRLLAQAKGFVQGGAEGARDLVTGFVKGAGQTVTGAGSLLAPVINDMAASAYHRPKTDLAPTDEALSMLDSTSPSESIGKTLEFMAETVGPAMVRRLVKSKALFKMPQFAGKEDEVVRYLANKGQAVGEVKNVDRIAYGALDARPKKPLAATQELLRDQRMESQALKLAGQGGEDLAAEGPVLSKTARQGVKAGVGLPTGKAPSLESELDKALQELLDAGKTNPAPLATGPIKLPAKAATLADSADGTNALDDLLSKIHGEDAPLKGNGGIPTEARAAVVDKAKAVVDKTTVGPASATLYHPATAELAEADATASALIENGRFDDAATLYERGLDRFFHTAGEVVRTGSFSGESGVALPKLLTSVAGGTVGAATGAAVDDEHPIRGALLGGAVGALTPAFVAHAYAQGLPKAMQKYIYTSVLSSPSSVVKAYSGAVGGAISAAAERIASGDVRNGAAILRRLFSPASVGIFRTALKSGSGAGRLSGVAGEAPAALGRIYGAADAMARHAMTAGGVSMEDAARYTLSGDPTSPLASRLLPVWNRYFTLRLTTSLFPRVGFQMLERGMERTPLGLIQKLGLNSDASTHSIKVARAVLGPAAAGLAYGSGDQVPMWAQPFISALAGPYGLLTGMAFAARDVHDRGGDAEAQLAGATQQFASSTPFPAFGPAEALNPASFAAIGVPNALRDVARFTDPAHDRVTAGQSFGRVRAKIPGLREGLPVRPRAVNAEGQPTEPTGLLAKITAARPQTNNPMKALPESVKRELDRLDVALSSPDYPRKITIGKTDLAVPPEAAAAFQAESRKLLIPRLQRVMQSSTYMRATDARKKDLLERARDAADREGAGAARVRLIRLLRGRS